MKRLYLFSILVFFFAVSLYAKEGGDQYPNGAEKWLSGVLPPPGSYFINYFGYYGGKLKDGTGKEAQLAGSTSTVYVTFDAMRYVLITRKKIWGASYGAHVIVPVVSQSMNLGGKADETAIGDITVNPFVLGWHHPSWHAIATVDFFLPTGHYNSSDSRRSIGANYYGFDPVFLVTYLPKSNWEATGKFMYNFKSVNSATNDRSGQEFHADYTAGKHLHHWMAGVSGYAIKQTTDDKISGQAVPAVAGLWNAGRRGRVLSVGPSVAYNDPKTHAIFILDWQHETLVRNRFGGDKFWFKAIMPLDGLFKRL